MSSKTGEGGRPQYAEIRRKRVTEEKEQPLLKVMDKIPMFSGLGTEKTGVIFKLSEFRNAEGGEVLCKAGEASSEMFVLLSGQLGVFNEEHVQLATIDPAAPVGEMGLITGQPRSATVRAMVDSNLLVIKKTAFDRLMRSNGEICSTVYRNVIQTMAGRLQESKKMQRAADGERAEGEAKLEEVMDQIATMRKEGF